MPVAPETLSFADQASLYYDADADVVAGIYRAGSSTIVFCRPETRLVCARAGCTDAFDLDMRYCDQTKAIPHRDFTMFRVDVGAMLDLARAAPVAAQSE